MRQPAFLRTGYSALVALISGQNEYISVALSLAEREYRNRHFSVSN